MKTVSFLGVKRPGRGIDQLLAPSSTEVKERVQLYLYQGMDKLMKKVMKDTLFNNNTELGHPLPVLQLVFLLE